MSFEIGFVPEGWTRGQPLRVMRAKPRWPGFVALDHTRLSADDRLPQGTVALVKFHEEEAANLDTWLSWWQEAGAGR